MGVYDIDIVLASYNGDKFITEQIESIQACSGYQALVRKIIVVDDGSTDNTIATLKHLAAQDSKIELHAPSLDPSVIANKGASQNFQFGLTLTSAPYIMLCDQDDVWLPEKLESSLHKVKQAEKYSNTTTPVLVFSDKQIVDEQLNLICDSYFVLKQISKQWHKRFEQLSQQNVASGCTMLFNRALLKRAIPIPNTAYMHDWWLALIASRCGVISLIDKPLIQYRQHQNNTIGAKQRSKMDLVLQFPSQLKAFQHSLSQVIVQAQAFQQFEKQHRLMSNDTISALSNLPTMTRLERLIAYKQGLITRSNRAGKIALVLSLLLMKKVKRLKG